MSDKKSQKKSASKRQKTFKKQNSIFEKYFKTPLIFVLISLVAVVPISIVMMTQSIKAVHSAQEVLTVDFNDITVSDKKFEELKSEKREFTQDDFSLCTKVGVLKCNSAAINTNVYYGANRVSFRYGVGLNTESAMPGDGAEIQIAGNISTAFKALGNVKEGDIITFESSGSNHSYTVVETYVSDEPRLSFAGEYLVLSSSTDSEPFSYFSGEKLYVVAAPTFEEVAQ